MTTPNKTKYNRVIYGSHYTNTITGDTGIIVDVYSVLEAFNVVCPARQHAIKKLLCAGLRGKGDTLQDLEETKLAVERAIQLEQIRQIYTQLMKGDTL